MWEGRALLCLNLRAAGTDCRCESSQLTGSFQEIPAFAGMTDFVKTTGFTGMTDFVRMTGCAGRTDRVGGINKAKRTGGARTPGNPEPDRRTREEIPTPIEAKRILKWKEGKTRTFILRGFSLS